MAIAAGVLCPDGLLIAADTEYSGPYHVVNATKVFGREYCFGAVLFAFAGHETFGKAAIQKCRQILEAKACSVKSSSDVRDIIISVLTKEYRDHVYPHPQYLTGDYDYRVIVGVFVKGEAPILYESSCTNLAEIIHATSVVTSVGTGERLFKFLIRSKTLAPVPSMEEMLLVIVSAISRCVRYVPEVGGNVEVAAIKSNGTLTQAYRHDVGLLQKHTGAFEEAATKLLRQIENPFITDKEFEAVLGIFSREIREVRKRWVMDDLLIQMRKELSK